MYYYSNSYYRVVENVVLKPVKPIDEDSRLQALHEIDILDTPINPEFERITRLTKKLMDVPMVAVSLIDSERQWFKSEQGLNVCQTSRDISFCGHAILQDEIFIVNDAAKDERFHDNPLVVGEPFIRFYAGYPIRSPDGYKIGSFCIMDTKPRNISSEDLEQLKDMAALVEQQLFAHIQKQYHSKIMKELNQAKREKLIDALTRVWNREGIEVNLKDRYDHSKADETHLALAMIDIDDFKRINDTYGHNAGDQVLREVTKRILTSLDQSNILGRWGGEEFLSIIALKQQTPENCMAMFEKARVAISGSPIEYKDKKINVTASFGITLTKDIDVNLEDIIAKADDALYQAKEHGKNKCFIEM